MFYSYISGNRIFVIFFLASMVMLGYYWYIRKIILKRIKDEYKILYYQKLLKKFHKRICYHYPILSIIGLLFSILSFVSGKAMYLALCSFIWIIYVLLILIYTKIKKDKVQR